MVDESTGQDSQRAQEILGMIDSCKAAIARHREKIAKYEASIKNYENALGLATGKPTPGKKKTSTVRNSRKK